MEIIYYRLLLSTVTVLIYKYLFIPFIVAQNLTAGLFGGNSYPPVLAGLQCNGAEGSFSNCTPINGDLLNSCTSQQAAAVACEPVIGNVLSVCLSLCKIIDVAYKSLHQLYNKRPLVFLKSLSIVCTCRIGTIVCLCK